MNMMILTFLKEKVEKILKEHKLSLSANEKI